ncbi:MAG: DUF3810 domain-containing protein [Bacteroidota bacterium]
MNLNFIRSDRRNGWILVGGLTILLRYLLGFRPDWIEGIYSRGLFLGIRSFLDCTFGLLPVPTLYLLLLLLLYDIGQRAIRLYQRPNSLVDKIKQTIHSLLAFLSALIFFFLFLWGFNYGRIPLEEQIQIDPQPLSLAELKSELEEHTIILTRERVQVPRADSQALGAAALPETLKTDLRQVLEQTLAQLSYPSHGHPRARLLQPRGVLLRISTAGFYLPFTGECHVDAGLHPLQLPFVMAHEYAHAYGITDEGSCNFLAYLTCAQSSDPFIRYSGQLSYWRYLAGNYQAYRPEVYAAYRKTLPPGIVADLNAINANSLKYPDILPELRDLAYDSYLKSQGISEGIESYSRIIMLVKAWKARQQ